LVGEQANSSSALSGSDRHPNSRVDSGDTMAAEAGDAAVAPASQWASWSNLWQIPTIFISLGLIGWGVVQATKSSTPPDVKMVLQQTGLLIATGEYKEAAAKLREFVEPRIDREAESVRAMYHVQAADLVFLSQHGEGVENLDNHKHIAEHYSQAAKDGAELEPRQVERWGESLLAVGDIDAARNRLGELDEGMAALPLAAQEEAQLVRRRLFRRIVETELVAPEIRVTELLESISDYRSGQRLDAPEELWAVARLAQLRLEAGLADQAIDFLLIEMRRLDGQSREAPSEFAELYSLLGRAYFERGDYDRAQGHLEHALALYESPAPSQGETLVLLGQIAASQGNADAALERFQAVANDYQATPSYLAGLLGLAEARSVVGDHDSSLADYQTLQQRLEKSPHRVGKINSTRVAESLCERHDASLAMGKLQQALRYAALAEKLFKADDVPGDVLFRLASTSRQVAENVLALALTLPDAGAEPNDSPTNTAMRNEANASFERAAEYFVRHSNSQRSSAESDDLWATSLWLAADSYDRAGRHDQSIQYFLNYVDRRPIDDPRRAETLFRIAQGYHAQLHHDKAIVYYEQVVADRSRTTFAAQTYVPLAQCYLALNRRTEAIAQLRQVLSGDRLLKPDARDYRDALLALAGLHYAGGEFTPAIEMFTEALQRYPLDSERLTMHFLLADSYRSAAMSLAVRLRDEPILSQAERVQLTSQQNAWLQQAMDEFSLVCEGYAMKSLEKSPASEHDQFRRARLYRADCAYYLGQYAQAVDLYDQVTRQYSTHHSSMYALVQIVNCYRAIGDAERTDAAHRRALARLQQLPDTAFGGPDALMDRAAWERWLEFMPVGPSQTASANAPTG
jgi:tetratricopeptide (TPR) repeat protein